METNPTGLTTREQVRTMLAAGLNPRQIANALNLSTQRIYKIKAVLAATEADEKEHAS